MKPVILVIALSALGIMPVLSQIPEIAADRPDQTETPSLVPKKYFQLESGLVYESYSTSKVFTHPSCLFKYGALDNMELRLVIESQTLQEKTEENATTTGLNPVEIGMKVKLFEERKGRPDASLIGHIGIPWLATKEQQPEYFSFNFRFTLQHTLTKWMSLEYNAGMEWDGESAEPIFVYTVTAGFSLTSKLGCYAEAFGFVPQKTASEHSLDVGFTYLVKRNLLLDISGGPGITDDATDYFVGCGVSFRLPD